MFKTLTLRKIITVIYGIIFLIIILGAYQGKLPGFLNKIPYYDTIGHLILYGIATYLGHLVFQFRKIVILGYYCPLWPLLFTIFTVTEEGLQSLSSYRTFSLIDLTASMIGIISGYCLAEKISSTK